MHASLFLYDAHWVMMLTLYEGSFEAALKAEPDILYYIITTMSQVKSLISICMLPYVSLFDQVFTCHGRVL
jgi:hypothetical protein